LEATSETICLQYGISNVKLSLGDGTTWRPNTAEWPGLQMGRTVVEHQKLGG
jgi:hypothetical protein